MSSGAGVVLAEERREEDGEGNDRARYSAGGEGVRPSSERSDSLSDGTSDSGELGPALNV